MTTVDNLKDEVDNRVSFYGDVLLEVGIDLENEDHKQVLDYMISGICAEALSKRQFRAAVKQERQP